MYTYEANKGNLHPIQTISTLPSGYDGDNSCSQIQITPDGKFVYAPNRGHNSIAGFRVNPNNGHLSLIAQTPTEAVPRAFSIDLQGAFLYVAGLETGKLAYKKRRTVRLPTSGILRCATKLPTIATPNALCAPEKYTSWAAPTASWTPKSLNGASTPGQNPSSLRWCH